MARDSNTRRGAGKGSEPSDGLVMEDDAAVRATRLLNDVQGFLKKGDEPVSAEGQSAVRALRLMRDLHKAFIDARLVSREDDADFDFGKYSIDSGVRDLESFIKALCEGKGHPLLDYWGLASGKLGGRDNRPDPTKEEKILRTFVAACAKAIIRIDPTKARSGGAREAVAKAVRESGAHEDCTPRQISYWSSPERRLDELDGQSFDELVDVLCEYGSADDILGVLYHTLKEQLPRALSPRRVLPPYRDHRRPQRRP